MRNMYIMITEADIHTYITQTVADLEEENQIAFPDTAARETFIGDCVDAVLDQIDIYGRSPILSPPEYSMVVLDTARTIGYLCV